MPQSELPLYRDTNLQVIFGVTLMAVLGVSSITPAFPTIVEELGLSSKSVGLLITVFTFPGVILTPILGMLADRFGRKKILIPSLLLFALAGGGCAFVRSFAPLLVLRFFQGVGAASLGSLNVTIIGDLYNNRQRAAAMGYNASVLSVGTASYPALGGALATLGWYYPFLLPFAALPVAGLALWWLENPEPTGTQNITAYLGDAWQSINNVKVIALFLVSIVTFIILYGAFLTYFPFLVAHTFKASPLVIGLIMALMSLSTAVTSSQLGKITKKIDEKTLVAVAFLFYLFALLAFSFVPVLWLLSVPVIVFGIAQGINIPSIQTLLAGLAPMEQRAGFMSLYGMVLRLGQTLGPILMGILFGLGGVHIVFYAGACFSLATAVMARLLIK